MTATINIKTDSELKKQAESLFNDLGMNMTTAFNIFLRQSVRENRIPFEITRNIYPSELVKSIQEGEKEFEDAKKSGSIKLYSTAEEAFAEL